MEEESKGYFSTFFSSNEVPLLAAESELLSTIQTDYEQVFVELPNNVRVNTLVFSSAKPNVSTSQSSSTKQPTTTTTTNATTTVATHSAPLLPPLLLVHGYGSGVGQWIKNFDALARSYRVIACDLVGFGRSTRTDVSFADPEAAEAFFVHHLHAWIEALRDTGLLSGKRKDVIANKDATTNDNSASNSGGANRSEKTNADSTKTQSDVGLQQQQAKSANGDDGAKVVLSLDGYDEDAHFLLCGHSLGAYVATAYRMRYHNPACQHLVLADPWGVPKMPEEEDNSSNR
jgi:alpha-beta hydrolase superfamily lysophospholipase